MADVAGACSSPAGQDGGYFHEVGVHSSEPSLHASVLSGTHLASSLTSHVPHGLMSERFRPAFGDFANILAASFRKKEKEKKKKKEKLFVSRYSFFSCTSAM
jgi:hypothetical protein